MNICPTSALFRRRDGIVDLNGESCIGCRACMAACPYDQLFIDPNTRTAEKCNFCANRIENKLEPACVSVCPTECRIFGDLDDPTSEVAQIVQREAFMVRKPEKGTGPEDLLSRRRRSGDAAGNRDAAVHVQGRPGAPAAARIAGSRPARARRSARGLRRAAQAGVGHRSRAVPAVQGHLDRRDVPVGAALVAGRSLAARRSSPDRSSRSCSRMATAVVLVVDLERPERFYYILTRPNWTSWLARGAFLLTGARRASPRSGSCCVLLGWTTAARLARAARDAGAFGATAYTGFLFAQGLARDLWQGPHNTIDLIAQAAAEGSAAMLLVGDCRRRRRRRRFARWR